MEVGAVYRWLKSNGYNDLADCLKQRHLADIMKEALAAFENYASDDSADEADESTVLTVNFCHDETRKKEKRKKEKGEKEKPKPRQRRKLHLSRVKILTNQRIRRSRRIRRKRKLMRNK
ncbi:hypothetical protein ACROYT_G032714 [Oculina patagonica]